MRKQQLEKYRSRLLEMRDRVTQDVNQIASAIQENINPPGDVSTYPTHLADRDTEGLDKEITLEQNETAIIVQIDDALRRIDDGSYGLCESCGKEIKPERLEALPFTSTCITCARQTE